MKPWSPEKQRERRDALIPLIRDTFRPLLNPDCSSERLIKWDLSREVLRNSVPFLMGNQEDVALGNRILRHLKDDIYMPQGFSTFECSTMPGILLHYHDRIEQDLLDFLVEFYKKGLEERGVKRDYQFHGYNDNMPVMWSWALAFGGDYFDEPLFTEIAWANLCQLRDMLRRRGTVSEFGVGYCTHRLWPLAYIAEFAERAEFRELARDLEIRVWSELAGHWHPRLKEVCGPSMRGDMAGGPIFSYENYALFYHVFGDGILTPGLDWRAFITDTTEFIRENGGDPEKHVFASKFGYAAEFADVIYHPTNEVAGLFLNKPSGFTFQCTAECGHFNEGVYCKQIPVKDPKTGTKITAKLTDEVTHIPHYPFTSSRDYGIVTHQGANFALGTSTGSILTSSSAFRCHYLLNDAPASVADFGSIHVRYNINEKVPGYALYNSYWKTPEISDEKKNKTSLYFDQGKTRCLQHENVCLCLQTPQPHEYWQVSSMRSDLFFANPDSMQVWYGNEKVDNLPFCSTEEDYILVEHGLARIGIVPLISRHLERQDAVRIGNINGALVISLYNYQGEKQEFADREMMKLGNGFLFIVEDSDSGSHDQFADKLASVKVLDQLYSGTRRTHCFIGDLRLSSHLCAYSDTFMYTSINGRDNIIPRFDMNGDTMEKLPFNGPLDEGNAEQDYRWLKTQFDRELPWYHPVE